MKLRSSFETGWKANLTGIVLFIVFSPILLPLLLVSFVAFTIYKSILYLMVWILWIPRGKDVLVVYSNSPIWHDYFSNEIIPLVKDRAVILNWSQRKEWRNWTLETNLFRTFAGRTHFNPMVMVFRPLRSAKRFRFWEPFKYWKRGDTWKVEEMKRSLSDSLS